MIVINEATRSDILSKSKEGRNNRYSTRMNVDDKRISINRVGMLEMTAKSPHLDIYFEINKYKSSVRLRDFVPLLQREYRSGKYDLSIYRDVRSLAERVFYTAINESDLEVDCTCPDFNYRFSYIATVGDFKLGKPEGRPPNKTNPDQLGSVCKHLTRVLNIPSRWKGLVITAVVRTINHDNSIVMGL